jgi:hypothetical protein
VLGEFDAPATQDSEASASLLHAHVERHLLLERVVFHQQHRAAHQRRTRH